MLQGNGYGNEARFIWVQRKFRLTVTTLVPKLEARVKEARAEPVRPFDRLRANGVEVLELPVSIDEPRYELRQRQTPVLSFGL
jgi:hypothetical protein